MMLSALTMLISVQIKGVILSTMGCMFFVLTQEASALCSPGLIWSIAVSTFLTPSVPEGAQLRPWLLQSSVWSCRERYQSSRRGG